jgi:hypothetical protein
MLAVRLCGPRVVARLESIGVRHLSDIAGRTPDELLAEVNIEAGRTIWRPPMATTAMQNLIAAADAERHDRHPVHAPRRASPIGAHRCQKDRDSD